MDEFKSYWTLYFHPVNIDKWDINSYKKIAIIKNIRDFHALFNTVKNYTAGMFFFMRGDITPIWEDPENRNGGMWSYKLNKKYATETWKAVIAHTVGETLSQHTKITGVSISPKLDNCIIKVWNNDKKQNDPKIIHCISDYIQPNNAFYKVNC